MISRGGILFTLMLSMTCGQTLAVDTTYTFKGYNRATTLVTDLGVLTTARITISKWDVAAQDYISPQAIEVKLIPIVGEAGNPRSPEGKFRLVFGDITIGWLTLRHALQDPSAANPVPSTTKKTITLRWNKDVGAAKFLGDGCEDPPADDVLEGP